MCGTCHTTGLEHLQSVLVYFIGTLSMVFALGIDDMLVLVTWTNVLFFVLLDVQSHVRGIASFVTGGLAYKPDRQLSITESSAEAELLDRSDTLPHLFCCLLYTSDAADD